jgi:plastocyanin
MTRRHIVLVSGLAAAALALAGCGGGNDEASGTTESQTTTETTTASGNTLQGSVGPGFEISLKDSNGQDVTSLAAGTYTITVDDQSSSHNFHLTGEGVDETTDVSGTGMETWTVTLKAGSYHFQCDPHSSSMNGDFDVT